MSQGMCSRAQYSTINLCIPSETICMRLVVTWREILGDLAGSTKRKVHQIDGLPLFDNLVTWREILGDLAGKYLMISREAHGDLVGNTW
jgi:hypothetical protein